jgi:tRNA G18 (ribose-2'-O)-methylase SpoU
MTARTLPVTTENHWFQLARTLKTNRLKRSRERLFFVEGVRSINELRKRPGWRVRALLYCRGRRLSGWARDVLSDLPDAQRLELTAPLMEKLADREEGSELLALVEMPETTLEELPVGEDSCMVVLDRPGNPGNLGSIIRSCDAFGASGVVIAGHAVDLFEPLVVRASAGAFFSQVIARADTNEEIGEWLARTTRAFPRTLVIGTSAKAGKPPSAVDMAGPVVLCFGSETMGLSAWMKSRCAELVGMPMRGAASSLNLAAAVTAVLYERDRQRRAHA